MKHKKLAKVLSILMGVCLIFGVLSLSSVNTFAISYNATSDDYYKVISKQDWELAPGITESEIVLNNDAGSHRQVAHVVEADVTNEYVKIMPSYTGMAEALDAKKYSTGVMTQQVKYAEENGYGNVVAAMNISLSWYDSEYYKEHPELIGETLGYLVMDGKLYVNSQGQSVGAQTCVVVNFDEKDGEARPADMPKVQIRSTSEAITGWEEQVIPANFGFLVKDGKNLSSKNHTSDPASRSFVGVKADGTFVMVMNDGRQAPYSTGFNSYEMADFMISLGCVAAVNGDGGGSSTFVSQRPGEEMKLNCMPSDGAERPTTHGILVISTAPSTGEFVRANITTDNQYFTPGSTVKFNALGTDLVGTEAEIPTDVTWQIKEEGMGTIENGVFVSNGTVGTATAQMVYNGAVVGEHSIEIVIPEAFSFMQNIMTIPFGKEVNVNLVATINSGLNEVVLKESDVTITLDNTALGIINGFAFTSVDEANAPTNLKGTLTATLNCANLTATASLSLGKGSEVLFDFENSIGGWIVDDVNYPGKISMSISHADSENGQVHDGLGSMRFDINTLTAANVTSGGYTQAALYLEEGVVVKNAKTLGVWVYVPDEMFNLWIRMHYFYDSNGDGTYDKKNSVNLINQPTVYESHDEDGWYYFSTDIGAYESILITGLDQPPLAASKNDPNNYRFIEVMLPHTNTNALWKENGSLNGPHTLYFDSITVDYSEAVDDREAPVFGAVNLTTTNEAVHAMKKRNPVVINENLLNIVAAVSENTEKSNATGLNVASAKAYIDGVEVESTFANGKIYITDITVADGMHRVKFEICDNAGNKSVVVRLVNVQSGMKASTIQVVPANPTLDRLYGGSIYWMNINATDIETIQSVKMIIDINGINHWELEHMILAAGFTADYIINAETNTATITITRTGKNTQTGAVTLASLPIRIIYFDTDIKMEGYTAETYWNTFSFWPQDLKVDVDMGVITYVDGYISNVLNTFSNEEFSVDTEMYSSSDKVDAAFKEERGTCHVHTPVALADKAATCAEAGYMGRTYCEVCDSVVNWGTALPVIEHTYAFVDGQFVCVCGDVMELGTGLYNVNGKNYYAVNGKLTSGWVSVDDEWYYFDATTFEGLNGEQVAEQGIKFIFENGRVTEGTWVTTESGTRYWYGPGYYRDTTNDAVSAKAYEIDGKTYLFNRRGYMQTGIVYSVIGAYDGTSAETVYYFCDRNGVSNLFTGILNEYFYLKGKQVTTYQLVQDNDGYYYFVSDYHKILKNKTIYLEAKFLTNTNLVEGYYTFDELGRLTIKNGPQEDGYFYLNGEVQPAYQLVEYKDDYYFINDYNKIFKNGRIYLSERFMEGTGLKAGSYTFDSEGRMIIKNGPQADGCFYLNGEIQPAYQIVEYEGNYYFINDYNKILKNARIYLSERFTAGIGFVAGYYEFDSEGRMVIKNGPQADGYFYMNNQIQPAYQLLKYENEYYFINDYNKILKDARIYLSEKFLIGTGLKPAKYEFDSEGRMIIKNGPQSDGYFYINGEIQNAYQLVKYGNDYYFINDYNKIFKNGRIYLSERFMEGTGLKAGSYTFDNEGRMIIKNGPQADGYFYINGEIQNAYQLVKYDDYYYFINDYNKILKNDRIYLNEKFLIGTGLEAGTYEFDSEGCMVIKNGPQADGYFYINNLKQHAYKIVEFNGDYYYITEGYKIAKNVTVYLNELVKGLVYSDGTPMQAGYYTFDEDGKMIVN